MMKRDELLHAYLAVRDGLTAAMGIWTQADRKLDAGGHEI